MAYELLVLDVDGTLVNTKKEITERTKEALWECQEPVSYTHLTLPTTSRV